MRRYKFYRRKKFLKGCFSKKTFIKNKEKLGLLDDITYGNY
jgi:hypothetical protein